jgi:hypothetical protein
VVQTDPQLAGFDALRAAERQDFCEHLTRLTGKEVDDRLPFKDHVSTFAACVPKLAKATFTGRFSVHDALDVKAHSEDSNEELTAVMSSAADLAHMVDIAESRQCANGEYSRMRVLTHSDQLGTVQHATVLGSGNTHNTTNNRAVVLVKHAPDGVGTHTDMHTLFVDRKDGTDPELFSTDQRMGTEDLYRASSVRHALGIHEKDENLVLDRAWRVASSCTTSLTRPSTNDNKAFFAVRWKPDRSPDTPYTTSLFGVGCQNRFRTDTAQDKHNYEVHQNNVARVKTVSGDSDTVCTQNETPADCYTTFNPEWRVHLVQREF